MPNFSFVLMFFSFALQKNRYRLTGCTCKLHKPINVSDSRHFVVKGIHRHAGDARKVGRKSAMTKLKYAAKMSRNPTRQVITNAVRELDKATLASLPSEKSLVKMVNRYRNNDSHPKNPRNLSELNLPDEYRMTTKGANFLLYDFSNDNGDDGRLLIFGTTENLKFLAQCDHVYMDGTFSVVPAIFKQLYTMHGRNVTLIGN